MIGIEEELEVIVRKYIDYLFGKYPKECNRGMFRVKYRKDGVAFVNLSDVPPRHEFSPKSVVLVLPISPGKTKTVIFETNIDGAYIKRNDIVLFEPGSNSMKLSELAILIEEFEYLGRIISRQCKKKSAPTLS